MRPSAIKSTSAKDSVRVRKETWIALVGDELARAIVSMHIATSGQSWQLLFFCPSGQHDMSPDIAAISLISPTGQAFRGRYQGRSNQANDHKDRKQTTDESAKIHDLSYTEWGTWEGCFPHMFAR